MSLPTWPATLPQALLGSGFQESMPDNTLRTPMDVSPAKVRRRSTAMVRPIQGRIIVTSTQLGYFKTFYETDLLYGSLRFEWVDPDDNVTTVEMRFTEQPSWTWSDGLYEISLSLEILA